MKNLYDKELMKRYIGNIVLNIALLIVITILSIIGPLLLKNAIDYSSNKVFNIRMLGTYAIMLTVFYVFKFIYNRFKFWFSEKFKNAETINLYKKVFSVSYEKLNQMEPSYLAERVSGTVDTIFNLYCSSITGIFISGLTMLIILIVVIGLNPVLALLYFLQIPIQYYGFQKLLNGEKSKLSAFSYQLQTVRAKNNKDIKAVVSDVNSVKQYSGRSGLLTFINQCISKITKLEREGNTYAMDICTILEFITVILKNGSYIYIIYLFVNAKLTIGDLIYFNLINDIYYSSIGEVINIQINLRDLYGSMKFVTDEIGSNYEEDGNITLDRVTSITGEINKIGYHDVPLIDTGNFEFNSGDVVALKGPSGSGKSTFAKTLNKFIKSNGIKVNGYDIRQISNHSLRSKIYYLAQNSYLLPFSIKENITLGETYPDDRWNELIKLDFMKKFVCQKESLDTIVYENASNLSGGDKQKIMLGRIFLYDPDVIILDESFSAIDEETGEDIINLLIKLFNDRIIIIISHSEHFLKNCNKRVIIKDKKLITSGSCL